MGTKNDSIFPEFNHDQLLSIGRKFSLVTPKTSLIVLENLEQYKKYKITPPKLRTKIYQEYQDYLKSQDQKIQNKIKTISEKFEKIKEWYNTNFIEKWKNDLKIETKSFEDKSGNIQKKCDQMNEDLKDIQNTIERQVKKELENLNRIKIENEKSIEKAQKEFEMIEKQYKDNIEYYRQKMNKREEQKKLMKKINQYVPKDKPEPRKNFIRKCSTNDILLMDTNDLDINARSIFYKSKICKNFASNIEDPQLIEGSIKIQLWSPNVDYLDQLKKCSKEQLYSKYIELRPNYISSPAFYLDVSDYFFKQNLHVESLRILSNIIELDIDSAQLIRIVAYKLKEFNLLDLSEQMFRKVLKLNPFEPQSYRDLALVLGKKGKYKESIQLLYKVVNGSWNHSFDEIELIALIEMNRMIVFNDQKDIPNDIPKNFLFPMKFGLRIVMGWDTNKTDIDLHTFEPSGEHVYYQNLKSRYGGMNTKDFTNGYGPESYMIKEAIPGEYIISARYYQKHQQTLTGATTILLTIFTNYGDKEKEECKQITIRLSSNKEVFEVGRVEIYPNDSLKEVCKENQESKEKLKKTEEIFEEIKKDYERIEKIRKEKVGKIQKMIENEIETTKLILQDINVEISKFQVTLRDMKEYDEEQQMIFEYEYQN